MYAQQQQPPLEAQAHLSADAMQQVVDDVSGPLYHQRQVPSSDYLRPSDTNNNDLGGNNYQQQQQQPPSSSTDIPTAPPTIDQLAAFVATMIHLLWHVRRSSVLALHSASRRGDFIRLTVNQGDAVSLSQGSDTPFQKFCHQILTATQLSESVVMLSLKYIAKLLQTNPNIQGAQGSEYRLFVVALLLANKFHDDNTFTNKTWADVSGMKLHELDIMELEFLGVLDFGLFIRKEEFDSWKTGLLAFMAQLQNATLMQEQQNQQQVIDSTLRCMDLFLPTPDPTWHSSTNNILAQQQEYLYLLSTAAQPEFRAQPPSNVPLPRIPLRIPTYPVYNNIPSSSSSSSASTTTTVAAPESMTANTTAPLPSSLTPVNAMYQPPPSSYPLYQQQNSQMQPLPTDPSLRLQAPPSLAYPAPARTSNRTVPRNMSTSSLAALAQSSNNPYNSKNKITTATAAFNMGDIAREGIKSQQYTNQQHQPYQRPPSSAAPATIPSDGDQTLVDYYAWKSMKGASQQQQQQQRLRSESSPSYYQLQQLRHQ